MSKRINDGDETLCTTIDVSRLTDRRCSVVRDLVLAASWPSQAYGCEYENPNWPIPLSRGQSLARSAADLRVFLSRSYNLEAIADDETDPQISITGPTGEAIATGRHFIAFIEDMAG